MCSDANISAPSPANASSNASASPNVTEPADGAGLRRRPTERGDGRRKVPTAEAGRRRLLQARSLEMRMARFGMVHQCNIRWTRRYNFTQMIDMCTHSCSRTCRGKLL